jgi:pimeloyl-ACP methyl ester carboxylesterase
MRRSSSSNNLAAADHERSARQPGHHFFLLILGWSIMLMLGGCSSTSSIPPWFEAFERLPVKTVTVNGQRMAYLDVGQGPPVILIHGFGGSMWQWEHQQTALSTKFRVITPDLIGAGFSDKPDIDYRPDEMLAFLVGFMDQLQIAQANVIGNSMGAGLAIGIALDHPTRISKLVLIDGFPAHVMDHLSSPTLRRALETWAPSWLVSVGNWLFGWSMTESILREFIHDPALITPALLDRSNRNRKRAGLFRPLLTIGKNLPLWEEQFAPRIGKLTQRTLILWGEEDQVFPIKVGESLNQAILGSRLIRIPQAGHIPQWERPDLVNPELIKFLQL